VPQLQAAVTEPKSACPMAALLLARTNRPVCAGSRARTSDSGVTAPDVDLRQTALRVLQIIGMGEGGDRGDRTMARACRGLTPGNRPLTGAVARVPTRRVGATTTGAPIASEQAPVALRLFLLENGAPVRVEAICRRHGLKDLARAIESAATRRRGVQTVASLQTPSLDDPPDAVGGR